MKIAVCGTHFTPALAVMEKLKEKDPDLSILFFGRKNTFSTDQGISLESKVLSKIIEINYVSIAAGRWQRFFDLNNLLSPLKTIIGIIESFYHLKKFQPGIILSFGGYASVPTVFAAWILNIPIVSHEQTTTFGLANRINSYFSKIICVSWPESRNQFHSKKIVLTGNPLRKSILVSKPNGEIKKFPSIFVTGGNQGAHVINMAVKEILSDLLEKFIVIHQCGAYKNWQDEKELMEFKKSLPASLQNRYLLSVHFHPDEMTEILQSADLVISRSGINTISELLYLQKKAIIIPLPFSANNEQGENARLLEEIGLGHILLQKNLSGENLKKLILQVVSSNQKIDEKKVADITTLLKNAADKVAGEVVNLYEKNTLRSKKNS